MMPCPDGFSLCRKLFPFSYLVHYLCFWRRPSPSSYLLCTNNVLLHEMFSSGILSLAQFCFISLHNAVYDWCILLRFPTVTSLILSLPLPGLAKVHLLLQHCCCEFHHCSSALSFRFYRLNPDFCFPSLFPVISLSIHGYYNFTYLTFRYFRNYVLCLPPTTRLRFCSTLRYRVLFRSQLFTSVLQLHSTSFLSSPHPVSFAPLFLIHSGIIGQYFSFLPVRR